MPENKEKEKKGEEKDEAVEADSSKSDATRKELRTSAKTGQEENLHKQDDEEGEEEEEEQQKILTQEDFEKMRTELEEFMKKWKEEPGNLEYAQEMWQQYLPSFLFPFLLCLLYLYLNGASFSSVG